MEFRKMKTLTVPTIFLASILASFLASPVVAHEAASGHSHEGTVVFFIAVGCAGVLGLAVVARRRLARARA